MPNPSGLPSVVIVGRPNVGKSTLFNRITGERRSIVGDEPGITRDRINAVAEYDGRRFEVIDTGGIIIEDEEYIPTQILRQAQMALREADHIIFLVDGRSELSAADFDLAAMLRKLGKPVSVAVNKMDTESKSALAHEFHSLGMSDLFPVSAEHGIGVDAMLEHIVAEFPQMDGEPAATRKRIRVAIIGRPNVGKSTLLNALIGQERSIVSPIAGTTRDAVDETVERNGVEYVFVDTAGIRRKGKTKLMAEKLSVVMARRHIRLADVVVVVLDATEGVLGLDATIAGYSHEGGRATIIAVNKWDLMTEGGKRSFERDLRDELKFLDYAPVRFLSAKDGEGIRGVFKAVSDVYESAHQRIPTGELNRFVESLRFEERRIYYITQPSVAPPKFVVFTDKSVPLHFSHERFLVNQIRKRFGFQGTPIFLEVRTKKKKRDA